MLPAFLDRFRREKKEERQLGVNGYLGLGRHETDDTPDPVVDKVRRGKVSDEMRMALLDFETNALNHIFGQNAAVRTLAHAMKVAAAGLRQGNKLVGAYVFKGPTGVGKTALAELVSELLPDTGFERIDMSEFQEKHTVSNLLGAPKSYVDSHEKGLLRELLDRHKQDRYLVILLDEIEKAHEDVFKLFLGAMDHATVTDAHNRKIDLSKVILVMSSNAGEKEKARATLGFKDTQPVKPVAPLAADGEEAEQNDQSLEMNDKVLAKLFDPEFINRLDGVVTFNKLDDAAQMKVTYKFIDQLKAMLVDNPYGPIAMTITDEAAHHIRDNGYNDRYGARPILRWIDHNINDVLSEEIIDLRKGKLATGGAVDIAVKEEKGVRRLTFDFTSAAQGTGASSRPSVAVPAVKVASPGHTLH